MGDIRVLEDSWSDGCCEEREYPCESIGQITAAIERLDGKNHTSLIITRDDDRSLTIAGGNDGRYMVFVTVGVDEAFFNLVDPSKTTDKHVEVVVGGQAGEPSERQCVTRDMAIKAAMDFVTRGVMSEQLTWETQ